VAPLTATLAAKGQQQFTATVTGDSNTAVNWSVGGPACLVGQDCGSIAVNGLYTAPTVVSQSFQVTVTATSQANAFDSGSAEIILNPPPASGALKGAYVFLLVGSDGNGKLSMAGKFIADGRGNIHSGEMTLCSGGQECDAIAFVGSYVADSPQNGTIELDASLRMLFHFVQNGSGRFKLSLDDVNGVQLAGTIELLKTE
jgi:hypothetical protein